MMNSISENVNRAIRVVCFSLGEIIHLHFPRNRYMFFKASNVCT